MASEVRHQVERGTLAPTVRLAGEFDASTADEVRATLLDVLATQPEALLVDISELHLTGDDVPLAMLCDLRRDTAVWPATRLGLCGSRDPVWQESGWPVWPDRAGARSDAARGASGPSRAAPETAVAGQIVGMDRLSVELDPLVASSRRCREVVAEACARWERTELADAACIVATELVNNVVAHARTAMVLLLARRADGLSVAVRDHSPETPVYTGGPVPPTSYGGRGMLLVDSVAARWGCLPLGDNGAGKVVWALLAGETADQRPDPSMVAHACG